MWISIPEEPINKMFKEKKYQKKKEEKEMGCAHDLMIRFY